MKKRTLGGSGIEVAPLGLACMRLSSKGGYAAARRSAEEIVAGI